MHDLINAVENYLSIGKTDYAFLIKGQWGCGKTFFYKNKISQKIRSLNYKPIYISLYGINSLDDISKKLFFELNPFIGAFSKSKIGKRLSELAKTALGSVSSIIPWLNFKPDFTRIKAETWLSLKNDYVLCFDDLERTKLSILEVLGYINNFVEHDNCKVIIIANEEGISEMAAYLPIKEKLIGPTIEYRPKIEDVLSNIIDSFSDNSGFQSFLNENRKTILEVLGKSENLNIRILKHALIYYRTIYEYLRSRHKTLFSNYAISILFFILSVSYAIKTGSSIDSIIDELKGIRDNEDFLMKLSPSLFDKKTKTALQAFYKTFHENTNGIFFSKAALNYVLNGFFDTALFDSEIKIETKENEDPKIRLLRTIYSEWFELSDNDFKEITSKLLNHIEKGEINIYSYPRLFSYYSYFSKEGLIPEKMSLLVDKFKHGISIAYESMDYTDIKSHAIHERFGDSEDSPEYKEITAITEGYVNKLKEAYFKDKVAAIFELLPTDIDKFIEHLVRDDADSLWHTPIFKYYSSDKLLERLIKLGNKGLVDFRRFLTHRYKRIAGIEENLSEDHDNLMKLKQALESYCKDKESKLSIRLLNKIVETLAECLEVLSSSHGKTLTINVGSK
ncbi:MAG: P-loop NTPase fold protein [Nitrospirota bacterium]|nr:P-loop NTPase fold protein [Nitrospirota bacterium]